MRCISCGVDVPPIWVKAIELNSCPSCGSAIMNEATQDLLKELSDALTRMPNNPQGVAGWLLSNYRFQKMGDAVPVEKFHNKGSAVGSVPGEINDSQLKIAPRVNDFVKRNDAEKYVARTQELAEKAKGSKNKQMAEFASLINGVKDPYEDPDLVETVADASSDVEDQMTYALLKSQGIDPFAESGSNNAPTGPMNVSQIIDQEIKGASKISEYEQIMMQSDRGREQLQNELHKKIKAQDAINGVGKGVFRR